MSSSLHLAVLALTIIACTPAPLEAPAAALSEVATASAVAQAAVEDVTGAAAGAGEVVKSARPEVVFDPVNPPPGYTRCQGKECHTVDGRILSYKQVMAEIGAVRMAGGLDTAKLPDAPSDVAAPPKTAERAESGLAWRVLATGTGTVRPNLSSRVLVHYSGWTTDGRAFDSSIARGRPAAFPLDRVIPGWQEALSGMVAGERRRVWVPEALAYKGQAGGPAGMLVFDLELVKVIGG
ncbi:MAG: FKBP-type peptidyl-prolyl cis-trans isomerase [Myxococcota bacterium]